MKTVIAIKFIAFALLGLMGLASAQNLRATKPVDPSPGAGILEENVAKAVDSEATHHRSLSSWVTPIYEKIISGYKGNDYGSHFYYWIVIKYCSDNYNTAWGKKNCPKKYAYMYDNLNIAQVNWGGIPN